MNAALTVLLIFSAAFSARVVAPAAAPSVIQPVSSMRLGRDARSTGNPLLERLLLLKASLPGPLPADARSDLARGAIADGNYAFAVGVLTTGKSDKQTPPGRVDQVLLGEAYLAGGDAARAEQIFTRIENGQSGAQPDDAAIRAVRGLDSIGTQLTEDEHLRRANVYQANREFAAARAHFQAVLDAAPAGASAAEAAFQIGRGYTLSSDHAEAISWYERVLERYPGSNAARESLLQVAGAYARVGKPKESIKRYQKFIEAYPADEKLDRAYLNIVDVYRDQGEDREALKWCTKTEEVFRSKTAEAVAIFAEARILIAREEWQDALGALERLRTFPDLGGSTPGGTDAPEIAFFRAFVLEQLGRYGEAVDAYLAIPGGRTSYYGLRADDRLRTMEQSEAARGYVDQKAGNLVPMLRSADTNAKRMASLGVLRLSEQPELRGRAIQTLKGMPKGPQAAPAPPSGSADISEQSLAAAETAIRKFSADEPLEALPRETLRQLYPPAFRTEVLRYAAEREVDPRFVLAIMRQESRFDPAAHSNASARGLMQLIMSTANEAAAQAGYGAPTEEDLFDPAFSILLGTQHLSDLFKIFPGQPEAVAGAYNASAENVKRWAARSRSSSPERYVPEIMFAQTKDYVAKVMLNYRAYQYLYDEQLNPK